jgi:oligopeptide transport system permease protein
MSERSRTPETASTSGTPTNATPERDHAGRFDIEAPEAATAGRVPGTEDAGTEGRKASLWSDAWRELRTNTLFLVASAIILLFGVMALFPGLFTNVDPNIQDLSRSLERPSSDHWFGFDTLGRDYYSRVIYGARVSMSIGLLVTFGAGAIALLSGAIAGYYGGSADSVLARIADIFFAIPTILAGIVFLSVLGDRGLFQVALVLVAFGWPTMMRIARSAVLSEKERDYVQAARALGATDTRIIVRHILPNSIAPVIVYATITVGIIIAAEATLSFLGVGLQLPAISWGLMVSNAQSRLLQAPHLLLFPGIFLSLTVFGFILMGDALRDALDPKLR